MPMMPRTVSIGANSTNDNVFSGSAFEFARGRGVLSMGIMAAAAGVIVNIQAGADIVSEAFEAPVATRYPIIPDDFYFTDVVEQGDRIVARAQNTTGGAIITRTLAQLSFGG